MFPTILLLAALTSPASPPAQGGDGPPCVGPDCVAGSANVEPPIVAMRVLTAGKSDGSGMIEYRLVLTNRSATTAFGVQVRTELPSGSAFAESRPVEPDRQQNMLTWLIGTMPGHSERVLLVKLRAKADGPVETCFRVAFEHGVCVTTQASCKPPSPRAEEQLPLPKMTWQLSVVKVAPARQGLGTPILYSLTVTNSGRLPIRDIELDDLFPANAAYVPGSASDNGQVVGTEGKKLVWKIPALLPQETHTFTFKVRPSIAGIYLNAAHARGIDPDGQTVLSKDATSTTEVSGAATIYMEVRDLVDPIFVNDATQYRILVRNTGNAPATNIKVVIDVPDGLAITKIGPKPDADASGHKQGDQRINLPAFSLQPHTDKEFTVEVQAQRAGLFRFRSTLSSDSLDPAKPPLVEEETTTVVNEKPPDSQTSRDLERRFELTSQPRGRANR
jgi:uncharacterized repeat protein (TIGR01451 family)